MKRYVVLELQGCDNCPNLEPVYEFATHYFYCKLLFKDSSESDGFNWKEVDAELQNWFENECPLPENKTIIS